MATRRAWAGALKRMKNTTKIKTAQPPSTWKIVKGDRVQVMNGDDKGVAGKVLRVVRERGTVIVENVHLRKKFVAANEENPKPGFFRFETPIHVSRVSLLDPTDGLPCRVKFQRNEETGKRERVSRRTGSVIEKPEWIRIGLEDRSKYDEKPWDTSAEAVLRNTYTPSALSFEEEVIQSLGLNIKL